MISENPSSRLDTTKNGGGFGRFSGGKILNSGTVAEDARYGEAVSQEEQMLIIGRVAKERADGGRELAVLRVEILRLSGAVTDACSPFTAQGEIRQEAVNTLETALQSGSFQQLRKMYTEYRQLRAKLANLEDQARELGI